MSFISDLLIEISSFRIRIGNKLNALANRIGVLNNLTTSNKTDLVNAINEVNSNTDNIEIGGRNLIIGSFNDWRSRTIVQYGYSSRYIPIQDDWRGKTVTHSFEVKDIPAGESVRIRIDFYRPDVTYITPYHGNIVSISGKSFVSYTVTPDTQYDRIRIRILPVNHTSNYSVLFRCEKLEFGNKPTDWTPAPEDQVSDWNESDSTKYSFIKNKPTLVNNYLDSIITTNGTTAGTVYTFKRVGLSDLTITLTPASASFSGVVTTGAQTFEGVKTFNQQINTQNHGNSSQWKQAFDWGDFRDYGLARTSWGNNSDFTDIDANTRTQLRSVGGQLFGIISTNRPIGFIAKGVINTRWSWMGVTDQGLIRIYATNSTAVDNYVEIFHTGNFNPAQYVLQSALNTQLANYGTLAGTQTWTGQNTYTQAIYTPAATLDGHAVNLGQLNNILDDYATETWVTQQINNISLTPGPQGPKGDKPAHSWSGTQLRFENPNGTWGAYVNLKGADGTNGTNGTNGIDGSKWFSGTSNPASGTGVIGDWYVNTNTWNVFEKTGASTWTNRGNIRGPQGIQGPQGPSGSSGPVDFDTIDTSFGNWQITPQMPVNVYHIHGNDTLHISVDDGTMDGQILHMPVCGTPEIIVDEWAAMDKCGNEPPVSSNISNGSSWVWSSSHGMWVQTN